ncbi:Outer membrane factor efflux transporter lipoprotein, NodT-like [Desulfonema limicola]|uniref:Outer membrane factor efflux transporter lipoprotein, NodT-like n=1 Tax=Desulfonema limicola TaxID=45656 RepID=A0A975GHS1_9BACT|nr:efflux transporter outer membrane subunit [Desulfonema limicola]QTA81855.1 Outer membrane factor efflux transporter lipoprotein, NodT-like [Desulfonema limicola]
MKRLLSAKLITGIITALLISSCTLGPDYVKPEIATPEGFKYEQKATDTAQQLLYESWWEIFNDDLLNQLILEAGQGNYELIAAVARVEQARAVARMSRSGFFPSIINEPSAQRRKQSETRAGYDGSTGAVYNFPINVGYELDLFGGIRRGYEAGKAEAEAVEEDYNTIRLILETDLAVNYFALRSLDEEIRIVSRIYDLRQEQLELLKSRLQFGVISQLPVSQAIAELNSTHALLFSLQREHAKIQNAIAVLLGKAPSDLNIAPKPLAGDPPYIPSVVPSSLLTARPDIKRVERQLAAENARIGVAEASFFPRVIISGDAGFSTSHIGSLFDSRSFTWGIGPNIRLPLFEGGRNSANLERAKARYAEVYANYCQSVIRAIGEVEDALVSVDLFKKQADANQLAVQASTRAHEISKKQFDGGLINYLSVLDAERTMLNNLRLNSQLRGQRFISAVNLIKSIGGSWQAR